MVDDLMLMQFLFAEYSQLSGLCKAFAGTASW